MVATMLVAGTAAFGGSVRPALAEDAPGKYVPLSPSRILDTRDAGAGGAIAANTSRDIQVTGRGGVPTTDVLAVVVSLSAVNNTSDGWGLVWQSGSPRPNASSINYVPHRAVTNTATVKVSPTGKISYYSGATSTDLIIDVVGYYRGADPGAGYVAVTQTRILDTREAGGKVAGAATLSRKLRGVAGIPDSPEVSAVALNLSTFNQEASGYVTVYPRGQTRPLASSMNYGAWRMQTQLVLATLSSDGWASFYTAAATDMLLDVVGYYKTGSGAELVPLVPQRVIDTRYAAGFGVGPLTQPLAPNTNTPIKLTGVAGVPETGVTSVLINAVADAGPSSAGFLSFWGSGEQQPGAIGLTYYPSEDTANLVMANVGSDGKAVVTNYVGTTALVIDVIGYFREPAPTVPDAPRNVKAKPGDRSATVTWTAPTGSAVTNYKVTVRRSSDGGVVATHTTADGSATNIRIPELTNGVSYFFEVVATNAGAASEPGVSVPVTPPGGFKTMTWNLARNERLGDMAAFADVIIRHGVDIVGLQEVGGSERATALAQHLTAKDPSGRTWQSHYDNRRSIVTRNSMASPGQWTFASDGDKGFIRVRVAERDFGEQAFVYNVHLTPNPQELRGPQAQAVLDQIAIDRQAAGPGFRAIVLGDFNEDGGAAMSAFDAAGYVDAWEYLMADSDGSYHEGDPTADTFIGPNNRGRVDHLLVGTQGGVFDLSMDSAQVDATVGPGDDSTGGYSDHRPVIFQLSTP